VEALGHGLPSCAWGRSSDMGWTCVFARHYLQIRNPSRGGHPVQSRQVTQAVVS
jgi:hypothetical protein